MTRPVRLEAGAAEAASGAAPSPLSKQRLRLWLRLLHANRDIESGLREKMRLTYDSTLPRFDVLAALARRPDGLRMSELSEMLRVSNGNVTGIVARLVAEGLVERDTVESDRRATRARLSPAGTRRFAEIAARHEGWVDELLNVYDAQELDTLIRLLSRLGENT